MSGVIVKWLSGWATLVVGILTIFYPPFFAGMASASIKSGHLETAYIDIAVFILVWPMLILVTIGSGQSFYRQITKRS